jgi:predicted nuclease of restriction endonuclease-like RecB superfamily
MLYIQESEDENRPFGPDTYALVDENLGGIVAYFSPDYLERMKEYIDTQNAPRELLVQGEPLDKDEQMVFDDND